jgi:hypothetical protein
VVVDRMPAITYVPNATTVWPADVTVPMPWARVPVAALAIATLLAMVVRTSALATYGLSEDELNKVHAIERYREGHFTANAEHPMFMKLAMWGSVGLARVWNQAAPPRLAMSIETAIRLPNAAAGAATTLARYGLADILFGGAVVASTITDDMKRVIGREPRRFADYVRDTAATGVWNAGVASAVS